MKKIISGIFALLLTSAVFGQNPHITYLGDPIPQKWMAKLEPLIDYEVEFYKTLGLADDFNLSVRAFKDRKTGYDEMARTSGGYEWVSESGVETAGVFFPSRNLVALFGLDGDKDLKVGVLAHEISHAFFHEVFPRTASIPIWLNEGLARYFERCSVSKKGIVKHEFSDYDKGRLKTKYMLGEMNPAEFVDFNRKKFMQMEHLDDMSAYRLAHALVTFLIEKEVFQDCFKALAGRSREETPSMMLDSAYPGGLPAFEADFRAFILQ